MNPAIEVIGQLAWFLGSLYLVAEGFNKPGPPRGYRLLMVILGVIGFIVLSRG